ncbi:MAG: prolyl-tRNA synthetase associated domain-containing protein, partial [Selenomonadaceae bacterium]|nr:prolyl-tRNA synthetase associated domain-containing protein [Selenomonadaceae bacterium]
GEFFLLTLPAEKRADLKSIAKNLNLPRLSFASEEELFALMKLHAGSVTPLGIINDEQKKVRVIIDAELFGKKILLHPNTNTATISISFDDLIKIIRHTNHEFLSVAL